MSEIGSQHLDSRRNTDGERIWGDYLIELIDTEAVESSPFRPALEGLKQLGLTEIIIGRPLLQDSSLSWEEDPHKWWVMGIKTFPDARAMVADHLGGELAVIAEISPEGERNLQFCFGAGENGVFNSQDLNEMIWGYLEVIHNTLSKSSEGYRLPIASNEQTG